MDPATDAAVVVLEAVSRWYGPVIGLNDVSLKLSPGVTGLLGPNGAGKSTLIRLACGEIRPSQGSVRVFGESPFANPRVLARVGVSPQREELLDHLTGAAHVEYLLSLGGYSRREARERTAVALEFVGLTPAADRRVGGYSKGMRQRLRLALATAHSPELVILDEPLTGMDPVGRREMIDAIRRLAEEGRTVLLSGHVLHEVEQMTRRIVLIHHGRVLAEGTLQEIRRCLDQRPHHIRVGTPEPHQVARALLDVEGVVSVRLDASAALFEVTQPDVFFDALMTTTAEGRLLVRQYETTDDNLQAIFDYLVA